MFCANGHENAADAKFCRACGQAMDSAGTSNPGIQTNIQTAQKQSVNLQSLKVSLLNDLQAQRHATPTVNLQSVITMISGALFALATLGVAFNAVGSSYSDSPYIVGFVWTAIGCAVAYLVTKFVSTELVSGATVAVDATNGQVTFNPDLGLKSQIASTIEKIKARTSRVIARSADGYVSTDGTAVPIYANIGRLEDTVAAVAAGADGVGLLRTELLYLDRNDAPTLQEQTAIYTALFAPFSGQKVVIRTLDAGADKPMAFINFDHEPNPALGVRGYRTIFGHEHLLRTQLQAIADAAKATTAQVWVMAPMITLPGEAAAFVSMAREYGLTKAGVMIEVPAAIFHANEITKVCDFVSIGTNDLGQYLHAADRESAPLAGFNEPWQPALLRAVHQVAQAGVKNNTPVGVCGEAASDAALASVLIGLGVSSLSCSVATLTDVAQAITAHSVQQLVLAGNVAIAANTAQDAKNSARLHLSELVNLGL